MVYSKIIFDVNNLFYRNYFTHQQLKTMIDGQSIETGGIYGTIKSIQKIEREYSMSETNFYFLFDNMSSKDLARKELDPDYKINRKKYSESFYRSIDYLQLILFNYSDKFYCVRVEDYEADDLLPCILSSFDKYDKVLVVSQDLDYSRCLSENVSLLQGNNVLKEISFKEKYGFFPTKEKVTLWKAIRGDKSDNIPIGVPGVRQSKLIKLIEKYKDIYELLHNIDNELGFLGDKFVNIFKKNSARLILNFQLVSFIEISFEYMSQFISKGNFNPSVLRFLYKGLGFKISEIDYRLMGIFPEKNNNLFFEFDRIKRKV